MVSNLYRKYDCTTVKDKELECGLALDYNSSFYDGVHKNKQARDRNHLHTTYTRNNMDQKCEGNCGLWVLNEMIK